MAAVIAFVIHLLPVPCALVLRLALAGAAPPASPAPYAPHPEAAPHPIRRATNLVLRDEARKKDLPLRVTWPDAPGPFPVILWSHGAYGSKDAYLPLTEYWAAHGYVVIQPTHEDSVALGNRPGDPRVFQTWRSRPADVSFILDSLTALEAREPALQGRLDARRIGVGGHSFGANTAQLTGGAVTREAPGGKSYADARVLSVMLLSGQGPGEMLTENSWTNFTRPLFVMTGSRDGPTRTGQPAQWRKKPYELSPPGEKYLVWVTDLDHGFGGITGVRGNPQNRPNADHVRWTQQATLAFWDATLKDNESARQYLQSDALPRASRGQLILFHK